MNIKAFFKNFTLKIQELPKNMQIAYGAITLGVILILLALIIW